jgi:uncharacterized membrane protein (UPF0127 family)
LCPTALALTVIVGACAPPSPPSDAATPDPPPAKTAADPGPRPRAALPEATLPDGTVLTLELALTDEERARGMMFRPSLPADRGMLFVFPNSQRRSFWMKDTLIALDIVYLDEQGRVVSVSADAAPCYEEPCPNYLSSGPAAAVLEVNAGAAAAHGVVEGARLEFRRVPGYPRSTDGVTPPGSAPGS